MYRQVRRKNTGEVMTRFSVCFNKSLCGDKCASCLQCEMQVLMTFLCILLLLCFSPPVSFDFDWCFKGMCVSMALLPVPGTENKHCATKEAMKWELGHWGVGREFGDAYRFASKRLGMHLSASNCIHILGDCCTDCLTGHYGNSSTHGCGAEIVKAITFALCTFLY